ncbi:MAG: class I SAM-dependent methyltransferase [Bacteroidota bacterium]
MQFIPYIDSGGIHIRSKISLQFEEIYLKVLRKENRIISDAEVRELPNTFFYNLHRQEWEMRAKNHERLMRYLRKIRRPLKIMDLGCGNGWLCNHLAKIPDAEIWGVDINLSSLQQAKRVCPQNNVQIAYGDIFEDIFEQASFDLIILNQTIEFFPNLTQLLNRCRHFLQSEGEIHIIDSPLYQEKELESARQKTLNHFEKLGVAEMSVIYFHHSRSAIQSFDEQFLYKPSRWFKGNESPFPWVRILN